MIDLAILHVTARLNESLRARFGVQDDLVVASGLQEPDGSAVPEVANKMVVFLVNVERDTLPLRQRPVTGGPRAMQERPPVFLNLMLMFAANFGGNNYREALKLLAGTIAFFQSQPVFDPASSPGLDPRFERLTMEIENLDSAQLSHLWSILGSRYLPSALYRLRMVTIDEAQVTAQPQRIVQPEVGVQR